MKFKTPNEQQKFSRHMSAKSSTGVQNILKISDTPTENKLEAIPEYENDVTNTRITEKAG